MREGSATSLTVTPEGRECACAIVQMSVGDAVRAGSLAGPATEAQVQVLAQPIVGGNASLHRAANERDATARRVRFAQGLAIGRTLRHAQTARDTAAGFGHDLRGQWIDVLRCCGVGQTLEPVAVNRKQA